MRTNIVIDDQLMAEAMRVSGLKTKREVVEEALRVFIRNTRQAAVLDLEGTIHWQGNLAEMRTARFLQEQSEEYWPDQSEDSKVADASLPAHQPEAKAALNASHG